MLLVPVMLSLHKKVMKRLLLSHAICVIDLFSVHTDMFWVYTVSSSWILKRTVKARCDWLLQDRNSILQSLHEILALMGCCLIIFNLRLYLCLKSTGNNTQCINLYLEHNRHSFHIAATCCISVRIIHCSAFRSLFDQSFQCFVPVQ